MALLRMNAFALALFGGAGGNAGSGGCVLAAVQAQDQAAAGSGDYGGIRG